MGDSNLDSNLLASSESDSSEREKKSKSEDISTKQTSEKPKAEKVQLEEKPKEPIRSSTRIVLNLKKEEKKELSDE